MDPFLSLKHSMFQPSSSRIFAFILLFVILSSSVYSADDIPGNVQFGYSSSSDDPFAVQKVSLSNLFSFNKSPAVFMLPRDS